MELLSAWLGNGAGERMKAPITDKKLLEMMWERFPEIMKRGTEQPAQRKPLTDEQFQAICNRLSRQGGWDGDGWDLALKEAIEAAHGIKEKNT